MIALDKDSEKSFDGESFIVMTSFFDGLNIRAIIKLLKIRLISIFKAIVLLRRIVTVFRTNIGFGKWVNAKR